MSTDFIKPNIFEKKETEQVSNAHLQITYDHKMIILAFINLNQHNDLSMKTVCEKNFFLLTRSR